MPPFITDRRLYLNADRTEVVYDGDPRARYLLAGAGCEVEPEAVARYGLVQVPEADIEAKAVLAPPDNKAVLYPPEVKRKRGRPKGYSPKKAV